MNSQELQILVSMRDEFSQKMANIEKSLEKSTTSAERARKGFQNMIKVVGGLVSVYGSLRFAMSAIREFAEEEQMFIRLATLTKNSTDATNEQIYALRDQAKALEQVGVISASNIITLQGQLATYDLNTKSIEQLTPALLDMAVAERGVNVTQQDMISMAEGVSKALQGNYASLQKRGFILSEDTKRIIENGTEQERVTEIVKVLNSTYANTNQIMAQTSSGSMAQFQNKLNAIKQEIGGALMPTLISLQDGFLGLITVTDDASSSFAFWGETIYRAANIGLSGVSLIKQASLGIVGGIDVLFTAVTAGTEEAGKSIDKWAGRINNASQQAQKAITEATGSADGFKRLKGEFQISKITGAGVGGGGFEALTGVSPEKVKTEATDIKKALDSFIGQYAKFRERLEDELFSLGESHRKTLDGFKKDIQRINSAMADLSKGFAQGEKNDRATVAEQIVANENRILEIQSQLKKNINKDELRAMEAELEQRKLAQEANAGFIASMENEIAEVKRVASLTDLERAIENYNTKRALAQQEYSEKMASLQSELREVRKAQKEEKALYQEKSNLIIQQLESTEQRHQKSMQTNLLATKEAIDKEIEYYRQLATAIDAVRGSNTASAINRNIGKLTRVNDAIIAPGGKIISTSPDDYLIATKKPNSLGGGSITINIDTMVGDDRFAEEIGNRIIKTLQMQTQLS